MKRYLIYRLPDPDRCYGLRHMSRAGYDTQGAVELQETFVQLTKERRQDWLSGLFASHPASQGRVSNNIATAATLPLGVKREKRPTSVKSRNW